MGAVKDKKIDNTIDNKMLDCLKRYNAVEASPFEVYYDIFKLDDNDTIQTSNVERDNYNFKTNPICLMKEENDSRQHYIMFKDRFDDLLIKAQQSQFAVMNALTYYGKRNKFDYANKMYAMIIDIDLVYLDGLDHYLRIALQDKFKTYPLADYLVLSGGGIHLYFVFEEPISLYPNTKILLKSLKKELTEMLWNKRISHKNKVEIQPLNQPFRVLGGKTKVGNRNRVFELKKERTTIDYLNKYVDTKLTQEMLAKAYSETKYSLKTAKEKFPDWYEKVIIRKDKSRKLWTAKEDLYEWWLRQITRAEAVEYGARYFSIMCLAIYAMKSGVSFERLKKDAYDLIEFMNLIEPTAPFTKSDVDSALECYDEQYKTFPIKSIIELSGIEIKKNKRNGRNQKEHLKGARALQEIYNPNWRDRNGRKAKRDEVIAFLKENKDMNVTEVARSLNVSRPTIYKYKKEIERESME